MRRPGPRGQKQLKESFGGSSVQALLEVTSVVRGERDLKSALATIVQTVAEALEFKTVVLNLYRPEFDDFCVADVYGSTSVVPKLSYSLMMLPVACTSITSQFEYFTTRVPLACRWRSQLVIAS